LRALRKLRCGAALSAPRRFCLCGGGGRAPAREPARTFKSIQSNMLIRKFDWRIRMAQLAAPFHLPEAPARSALVAKYFPGFGAPRRLRILELLRDEGELSVGELVERLGEPQPKVSNHLACLRWCGFVEARREHRTVYNRIADRRVVRMLDLAHALLEDNEE